MLSSVKAEIILILSIFTSHCFTAVLMRKSRGNFSLQFWTHCWAGHRSADRAGLTRRLHWMLLVQPQSAPATQLFAQV